VEIRPAGDMTAFLRPVAVGFGNEPVEELAGRFAQLMDHERAVSAFEDGQIVGSAGAFTYELTVPGGHVPAAGVTFVGVLPSHRRRGILTELMRVQLDDVRLRGEPVAILWASEERIYGRYGYGLAALGLSVELATARVGFRDDPGRSGRVRIVGEDEAFPLCRDVYERVRAETPGMVSRSDAWWTARRLYDTEFRPAGFGPLFRAVWEQEAYALYRVKVDFSRGYPAGELDVLEAVGASLEATREIWRYLFSVDLIETVKSSRLPVDHPLLLMLAEPRRLHIRVGDTLWVRPVDVGAALEARARADGSVVLELTDAFLPDNAGRWRVGGGGVGRTDDDAELALDVADLGSVYLGGFGFGELVRAGRARELEPGAAERADRVFAFDRKPWCPEIF
jgi:predicted acetyltransferase